MKKSKVKKAAKAAGDKPEENKVPATAAQAEKTAPDNKDAKPAGNKGPAKQDPLVKFQALEWHLLTLACTEMDEAAKKERMTAMQAQLCELANELKTTSRKKLGLSAKTIDTRFNMACELAGQLLKSGKRYPISPEAVADAAQAQAAMNKYEANEWRFLEQGLRANEAAQGENADRQAGEQEKLFKSAEQYFGASTGLAGQSEKLGIPKEVVQKRSEQRLSHLGNDPGLKDMRNPGPDAYMLSGSAAFVEYVKQLIEKLAKAIKQMVAKEPAEQQPDTEPMAQPAPVRPS